MGTNKCTVCMLKPNSFGLLTIAILFCLLPIKTVHATVCERVTEDVEAKDVEGGGVGGTKSSAENTAENDAERDALDEVFSKLLSANPACASGCDAIGSGFDGPRLTENGRTTGSGCLKVSGYFDGDSDDVNRWFQACLENPNFDRAACNRYLTKYPHQLHCWASAVASAKATVWVECAPKITPVILELY